MVDHLVAKNEHLRDVERLCGEIVSELQEIISMTTTYRDTIGAAARHIAHMLSNAGTPASADPDGHAFALALGRMAGIEGDVERLLPRARGAW